jgi:phosphatidylserine/phosphatidylglycerophosphate/cardiolipin synthase-like enzyme
MVLSLALGVLPPSLPAAWVAQTAAVAACFAPEEDCAGFAARAIENAESEILVAAYGLTIGSGIVEALARATQRGVDVRLIADRTTPCGRNTGVPMLADAGVPIWIDDQARIAHQKAMVIDEAVDLTGSYNGTRGAADNSEDLNLISSRTVATAYAAHWHNRLAVSVRFERQEDWCRNPSAAVR